MIEDKTYYRRHLPHYQPPQATYFITIRLAGSLPAEAIERLRQERDRFEMEQKTDKSSNERTSQKQQFRIAYFKRFDSLLDGVSTGPKWLTNDAVAEIVCEAIHYRDGREYDLFAYCIMPNHIHIVFELVSRVADPTVGKITSGRDGVPARLKSILWSGGPSYIVTDILASLKKFTALRSNRVLHRTGAFWQDESYDHVIRNEDELERTVWYVLSNPEKAGFVQSWKDWRWLYYKPGLIQV